MIQLRISPPTLSIASVKILLFNNLLLNLGSNFITSVAPMFLR